MGCPTYKVHRLGLDKSEYSSNYYIGYMGMKKNLGNYVHLDILSYIVTPR